MAQQVKALAVDLSLIPGIHMVGEIYSHKCALTSMYALCHPLCARMQSDI